MKKNHSHKIILFDGVCNLCNSAINFVIDHDKKDLFKFAPLQEEVGQRFIREFQIDPAQTDSIVLIDQGRAYIKSTAALRIARHLNGAYPLLYIFIILPPFLRNWGYDWVARNRYKWFGKRESCRIPTPELREKFL